MKDKYIFFWFVCLSALNILYSFFLEMATISIAPGAPQAESLSLDLKWQDACFTDFASRISLYLHADLRPLVWWTAEPRCIDIYTQKNINSTL